MFYTVLLRCNVKIFFAFTFFVGPSSKNLFFECWGGPVHASIARMAKCLVRVFSKGS